MGLLKKIRNVLVFIAVSLILLGKSILSSFITFSLIAEIPEKYNLSLRILSSISILFCFGTISLFFWYYTIVFFSNITRVVKDPSLIEYAFKKKINKKDAKGILPHNK